MSEARIITGNNVELCARFNAFLGEGPVWDEDQQALWWVDIFDRLVHRFDPKSGEDECYTFDEPVGAVALRGSGGLVVVLASRVVTWAAGSPRREVVAQLAGEEARHRLNDARCDHNGNLWVGSVSEDKQPNAASLYRLDTAGRLQPILRGVTISNGLDWTPSGDEFYYIDSPTQSIDVFRFAADSGRLDDRRVAVSIASTDGLPDGMTVDADGFIWVALYGGGRVRRYAPDGMLDMEIQLPVSQVTSCTFGGPDLMDLYITTGRKDLPDDQAHAQPLAGALFRCRPGVRGRLPQPFGG